MSNSILYLGHFDNTGYGEACQGYVNALLSAGYNVIGRHIPLNGPSSTSLPIKLQKCLNKPATPAKYCIQHTLPVYWQYSPYFEKNIGLFVYEVSSLVGTGWISNIKEMDAVIVANKNSYELVERYNKNTYLIPHAFDISKYYNKYKSNLKLPNTFKFYTIGEFTNRKNLEHTIRAFHSAFNVTDKVDLIIKTNRNGVPSQVLQQTIQNFCTDIKKKMKLYGNNLNHYKQEIIITDRLSENDINFLHQECQVFVNTSCGEGFSIPTFEAVAFENPVIATSNYDFIPIADYPSEDYCYGNTDTLTNLYTGKHLCHTNTVADTAYFMKFHYKNYKKKNSELLINKHSYSNIGKMFNSILV